VIIARSVPDLVKPPIASKWEETRQTPDMSTLPTVGSRLYKAARVAGEVSDPLDSIPSGIGANPAETPTAEPVEEPHGFFKSSN
jgi:hypothetical protein